MKQRKSRFNLCFIILITGLLFGGDLVFSQDAVNPEPVATEEHDTRDLEQLLKRYNTDQEKILEDTSKIHNIEHDDTTSEVSDTDIEYVDPKELVGQLEQAKKHLKQNPAGKAQDLPSSYSNSIRIALQPLQKLSEKEILELINEGTLDSPMRPYLDQFPKISLFAVRLLKDKESIPAVVKIVENKDRLISFASVMLFTILLGFLLKRFFHKEGRSFLGVVFYYLLRVHIMLAVRIAVLYYFFSNEFAPAAKVFKQTFL